MSISKVTISLKLTKGVSLSSYQCIHQCILVYLLWHTCVQYTLTQGSSKGVSLGLSCMNSLKHTKHFLQGVSLPQRRVYSQLTCSQTHTCAPMRPAGLLWRPAGYSIPSSQSGSDMQKTPKGDQVVARKRLLQPTTKNITYYHNYRTVFSNSNLYGSSCPMSNAGVIILGFQVFQPSKHQVRFLPKRWL